MKKKKVTPKKEKFNSDTFFKTKLDIKGHMVFNAFLICLLFIGAISLLVMATNIQVDSRKSIIDYEENSSVTYDVTVRKNNFYQSNTLGMNQLYPTTIIDKINIHYKYNFKTEQLGDYQYKYFTVADLVINDQDINHRQGERLLTRSYQLENTMTGKVIASDNYSLEKDYVIDYATYNTFVNKYRTTYALIVDAYLKVSMHVAIVDECDGKTVELEKVMDVTIPLATNPVKITTNNPKDVKDSVYSESSSMAHSYCFVAFAVLMFIAAILLFVQEFRKVMKSERAQTRYINKLNRILSANNEVIVRVKNKINLANHNIIEVESIEELLDAQNELRIPIAYFETKSNKEGYFVIVNGKEVWRYIFRVEEEK